MISRNQKIIIIKIKKINHFTLHVHNKICSAEVTKNAVIKSIQHAQKASLRSPSMFPVLAVVDPALMISVPPVKFSSFVFVLLDLCVCACVCVVCVEMKESERKEKGRERGKRKGERGERGEREREKERKRKKEREREREREREEALFTFGVRIRALQNRLLERNRSDLETLWRAQ